jgi:hypothetical protein
MADAIGKSSDSGIKDEVISSSTTILDKIQNGQIRQKLTDLIAALDGDKLRKNKQRKRKRSVGQAEWDQLSLSRISDGLPNKKTKHNSTNL